MNYACKIRLKMPIIVGIKYQMYIYILANKRQFSKEF